MVKGFKKAWLLKAGVIFLAAIIGAFMLMPAGFLFAQAGILEGRWDRANDYRIEISGTTGTYYYLYPASQAWVDAGIIAIGDAKFINIAQVGDNQWTCLQHIYIRENGEPDRVEYEQATITMSADGNSFVAVRSATGERDWYYRIGEAPVADTPIEEEVIVDGFNITASSGSGGSISDEGVTTVAEGGSKTYTITPQSRDYEISDVLVDGVSVGAVTSYTFENVQGNHTIYVDFGIITKAAKPAAEPAAEPVAVEPPVEELPYTGFDWGYPFMGLVMVLTGIGLMLALKKLRKVDQYTPKH